MSRKAVTITNTGLFSNSTISDFAKPSATRMLDSISELSGSVSSSSFDSTSPGSAFQSTQQLPVDWAKFEKHTFFDSAESKVNVAFDTIINFFPFDSTVEDLRGYLDSLTGYEKYVFDSLWPKYKGYLHFSGTVANEDPASGFTAGLGTHINVVDQAGYLYPTLSKRTDSAPIIDFSSSPFTCAFHINIPETTNLNSTVLQKLSDRHGFSVILSESNSIASASLVFMVSSGSTALSASVDFQKSSSKFSHCAAVFTRRQNENPGLLIYKDGILAATSSQTADVGLLNFKAANLLIGSGTNHYLGTYSTDFIPATTLSGTLDDVRIYKSEKNKAQIKEIASGTLSYGTDLLAFYRFNEATGSYTNNNIVLDHSGNSLHATVANFTSSLREEGFGGINLTVPMPNEDVSLCPVLFPSQETLISLNKRLLLSASLYDSNNPNLITRMIPRHYLEIEAAAMGYGTAKAGLGSPYSSEADFPGGGDPGSPQLIASLLFMWAKFFDEMKLFMDQFGALLTIDYDKSSTVADIMLPFFAKHYGIALPNMFSDATVEQYLRGQNVTTDAKVSAMSLAQIQSEIWRRILINIQDAIKSKGTIHGIKSIMRATGIDPDTMFRFREIGGSRELDINRSRVMRTERASLLKLSSTSLLESPFLSGSRTEVGSPGIKGTFVEKTKYTPHGISNWTWDGLFTSGSWTVEFLVKPQPPQLISSMSLSRVASTGSSGVVTLANCVGVGTSDGTIKTGSLSVFHRPVELSTGDALELILTGTDVFDGNLWHVTYGRKVENEYTSSYFLRAGYQDDGKIVSYATTSKTASFGTTDMFSSGSVETNASGSFLQFGVSSSMKTITAGLNNTSVSSHAKLTNFSGSIGRIRFWTKELTEIENKEHIRNFKSLGVEDPLLNFGFVNNKTGSFEKLRIDAQCDQEVTQSSGAGKIEIFDYSQNLFSLTGSGFGVTKNVMTPHEVRYSILNPKFDERSETNKVRILGYSRDENVELYNSLKSPVTNIPLGTPVDDDTRFSIEISSCKALNDDIILILGSLDFFENAIGSPELMFAQGYPDLDALRDVYFNRLTDKINYKNLISFYKWIDNTIGFIIARFVPSSTSFLGMNFVIESHMLERNKMRYLQEDIYLGENDRRGLQTDLNLQQVVGQMKRY